MKKVMAIIMVSVLLVMCVSCGIKSKVVGSWQDPDGIIYTFKRNGKCSMSDSVTTVSGTYSVKDSTIELRFDGETGTSLINFSFEDDDTLIFKIYDDTITLKRK